MRWVGLSVVLFGVASAVSVRAESSGVSGKPGLPVAVASFPIDGAPVAPAPVPPAPAMPVTPVAAVAPVAYAAPVMPAYGGPVLPQPAWAAPVAAPAAAPQVAPAPVPPPAAVVVPVSLDACPVSRTGVDAAAVVVGALLRDAGGLFAALTAFVGPTDTQEIDNAAGVEVRRIAFMRQLAATREEEGQREFEEKLSLYLRKRAFLQGLATQQTR